MRKENDLVLLNISLSSFEGEGGGGATGGESGVAPTGEAQKASKEPVVVYGKQDDADPEGQPNADVKATDNQQLDPSVEFDSLIKGQYKEQFEARIQSIIDKRFKAAKETESKLNQVAPIVQLMMDKYGVNTEAEAMQAYEAEALEEMAYKNNMDVDTYRDYRETKIKAQLYDQHNSQQDWQEQVNQKVAGWFKEAAETMKDEYPEFDFKTYVNEDPEFIKLLEAGFPVKQSYEMLNIDNLKAKAAQQAQSNAMKSIQANGGRPKEAAAQANSNTIVKSSVGSLTREDRARIAKEVQSGKTIKF